jgi:glutamate dehydrogenase/leucine dehydrogenase
MGTDEVCMAWVHDETGRSVGLPRVVGGIPLDEIGATGFGVAAAVEAALPFCDLTLKGARVAVQGFGAVGQHAARFLAEKGAVLVAAADTSGTLVDERGLDLIDLLTLKQEGRPVTEYPAGEKRNRDAIVDVPCDIWIPAARPDVLHAGNVARLQTKLVAQGANIPATPDAEAALHQRGILVLPDFIANAGGVICAATEYHGGTEAGAFAAIAEKIGRNTRTMLEDAKRDGVAPRAAAMAMATRRVREAAATRRWR